MARTWLMVAGVFLLVQISCAAAATSDTDQADNSSDIAPVSRTSGDPEQNDLADGISAQQESIKKVRSEYDDWAAQVDQALQDARKTHDTLESPRIPVSKSNNSESVQVSNPKTSSTGTNVISSIARTSFNKSSNVAMNTQAKNDSNNDKKVSTPSPAANVNQNSTTLNTSNNVVSSQSNVWKGLSIYPEQQNNQVNTNTQTNINSQTDSTNSKGLRVVRPTVTVVTGSSSVKK